MIVDFAFICDYAEVSGKINAMGIGFDTIYASQVPCKHPHFFFVMQLLASVVEAGEKDLAVHLIDDDGKDILPALKVKFAIPPAAGTESVARIALQMQNVEFPRYGSYSLHATVGGLEMVEIPLKVSPPPAKV